MAAPSSRAVVQVKDYQGLVSNNGPTVSDPASGQADELVNLMPLRPGELAVRGGLRVLLFQDETPLVPVSPPPPPPPLPPGGGGG